MFRGNNQQAVAVILARDGSGQKCQRTCRLGGGNGGHSSLKEQASAESGNG